MTDDFQSEDEVVNSEQAVELKRRQKTCEPTWVSVLFRNVDLALAYANDPPVLQPGAVLFQTLPDNKVRVYALR